MPMTNAQKAAYIKSQNVNLAGKITTLTGDVTTLSNNYATGFGPDGEAGALDGVSTVLESTQALLTWYRDSFNTIGGNVDPVAPPE